MQKYTEKTLSIRIMNDTFRHTFTGGRVVATSGIFEQFQNDFLTVLQMVRNYEDFSEDNDPHGEHDFGAFDYMGHKIFWKIDYYDRQMEMGSPDPADPAQTTRVLTVFLASEY